MSMMPRTPGPTRNRFELIGLLGILLAGALLRWALVSRATVEHFDEGVYASNLWFGAEQAYRYPARHLYAPPLLPALIEWTLVLTGNFATGPLAVSLLAGTLTPWLVWRLGRRWFSPAAGLAAASLCAGSELHVVLSRAALTDVLLVFWVLVAVDLLAQALEQIDFRLAVLAGLATGAAWWTKYNGWLPLAIGGAGLVVWWLADRTARRCAWQHLAVWGVTALVAAVVWSPVLAGLQSQGGYASVAANHRTYVVGFAGWTTSFDRQWANLRHFEGWVTLASLAVAGALVGWMSRTTSSKSIGSTARRPSPERSLGERPPLQLAMIRRLLPWSVLLAAGALAAGCGMTVVLLVATMVAFAMEIHAARIDRRPLGRWLPRALLLAWIVGLFVMTPCYWPYARLTLPLVVASWLGGGYAVASLGALLVPTAEDVARICRPTEWPGRALVRLAIVLFLISAAMGFFYSQHPKIGERSGRFRQPRDIFAQIAVQILRQFPDPGPREKPRAICVYGEPALFYQLRAHGAGLVIPTGDLETVIQDARSGQVDILLVTGPHAHGHEDFVALWRKVASQIKLRAEFDCLPSDLVLLDHMDPRRTSLADPAQWQVRVYRVAPPASHPGSP